MASPQQLIEEHKEGAEIYQGSLICKEKTHEALGKKNLPKGLFPLNHLVEVGFNHSSGFMWLKSSQKTEHKFTTIGRVISYDLEITAFMEDKKLRKLTGVKSKELFMWVAICDVYINQNDANKISFAAPSGLSRTFAVSALEGEE